MSHEALENLSHENRTFPPSAEFAAQANGKAELYAASAADHEGFWAEQARSYLTWAKDFEQTLDWSDAPFAKWFVGGELNASYNCVDRHVEAGRGDKVAIHFVGEPGDTRDITYSDLLDEVQRAANALQSLGVRKGDRVAIYLPMIPEAVIAMLACARIGAPHSVVFGGFSADALRSRIGDAKAKVVVTADGGYRRGAAAALAVLTAPGAAGRVAGVATVASYGTPGSPLVGPDERRGLGKGAHVLTVVVGLRGLVVVAVVVGIVLLGFSVLLALCRSGFRRSRGNRSGCLGHGRYRAQQGNSGEKHLFHKGLLLEGGKE